MKGYVYWWDHNKTISSHHNGQSMDNGKIMLDKWKAHDIITLKIDTNQWEVTIIGIKLSKLKFHWEIGKRRRAFFKYPPLRQIRYENDAISKETLTVKDAVGFAARVEYDNYIIMDFGDREYGGVDGIYHRDRVEYESYVFIAEIFVVFIFICIRCLIGIFSLELQKRNSFITILICFSTTINTIHRPVYVDLAKYVENVFIILSHYALIFDQNSSYIDVRDSQTGAKTRLVATKLQIKIYGYSTR